MKVYYRIYPGKPDNRPFANDDKLALVRACLKSFLRCCDYGEVDFHFLLDGCPDDWAHMVHYAALSFNHTTIQLDGIGNKPSFLKQLEMALDGPDDEFVYFAEDDYLYRPEAIIKMLAAHHQSNYLKFFTPYDHPDRYVRLDNNRDNTRIVVVDDWHWRTVESTTMTFGAPRSLIRKMADIMREHACEGRKMWYPILEKGYTLWGPMPSLATHVYDGVLAPCVDWNEVWGV